MRMKSTCEICWPCGSDSGRTLLFAILFIIRNNAAEQLRHSDKSALDIRSQPALEQMLLRRQANDELIKMLSET